MHVKAEPAAAREGDGRPAPTSYGSVVVSVNVSVLL